MTEYDRGDSETGLQRSEPDIRMASGPEIEFAAALRLAGSAVIARKACALGHSAGKPVSVLPFCLSNFFLSFSWLFPLLLSLTLLFPFHFSLSLVGARLWGF